jgi:GAF domain-containing protein
MPLLPGAPQGVDHELAAVHARLSGVLLTEQTMDTALQLITSLARDTLAGSRGSGVTLAQADGEPATSASTDPLVDSLDRLQYALSEGPCLDAWASSTVIRVDDLSTEQRWPTWSPQAAALGMRSVLSAPMEVGGTTWGATKVYADNPGAYDTQSEDLLRRFSQQAAIFVSNVHTARSVQRVGEDAKRTLRARDVIATATGMVMAHGGFTYEGAYRRLVWFAGSVRLPVLEFAERMVHSPAAQVKIPPE